MRQLPEAWRSGRLGSRQIKLGKRFGPSPSYRSLLVKDGPFPGPSDALARALLPCEKARAYGKPVEGNLCGVWGPGSALWSPLADQSDRRNNAPDDSTDEVPQRTLPDCEIRGNAPHP